MLGKTDQDVECRAPQPASPAHPPSGPRPGGSRAERRQPEPEMNHGRSSSCPPSGASTDGGHVEPAGVGMSSRVQADVGGAGASVSHVSSPATHVPRVHECEDHVGLRHVSPTTVPRTALSDAVPAVGRSTNDGFEGWVHPETAWRARREFIGMVGQPDEIARPSEAAERVIAEGEVDSYHGSSLLPQAATDGTTEQTSPGSAQRYSPRASVMLHEDFGKVARMPNNNVVRDSVFEHDSIDIKQKYVVFSHKKHI